MKTRPPKQQDDTSGTVDWIRRTSRKTLRVVRRRVPPGLRLVLGLALMAGGVFGFLPVLGFWMLPLGFAVAALDVKPLAAAIRSRFRGDK